jgi:hypothetical protein
MRRPATLGLALAAALALAGCEKAQTVDPGSARKSDTRSWEGTQAMHTASGYKSGDKAAWEAHLKARAERGQNEYSHTSAAKP